MNGHKTKVGISLNTIVLVGETAIKYNKYNINLNMTQD